MGAIAQILGASRASEVTDNFNRANSASTLNTSSSGQSWTAHFGTWGISSNQAYLVSDGGGGHQNLASIDCGNENGTISVTVSVVPSGDSDFGILFRYVDINNFYLAIYTQAAASDDLNIYKCTAGSFTLLASLATNVVNNGDILTLMMHDNTFDFRINGVNKVTISDSAHHGTRHGLRIFGDTTSVPNTLNTRFDNFAYTPTTESINVAVSSRGAVAVGSSNYVGDANYHPSHANDGQIDNHPAGTGALAWWGWNDNTISTFPDFLEIDFNSGYPIRQIDVFSLHDSYTVSHTSYTLADTFTLYGLVDFNVEYWNGSSWVAVTGGTVTGNNKIWRQFTFAPVSTMKIRVYITACAGSNDYSRIVEIQAWT